ncbi:MAG TPA: methionyl-tRNA formyltransferase [Armatimonadota bacterium]|nr:methionyl-tRNA formyltransferase [Armatimonadota bacterium]
MKILYFGTSIFAQPPLRALVEHEYTVVGVVTQPDRPAGRGGKLTAPPVKELALQYELPIFQPESCRANDFLDTVRSLSPDLIIVAAYGQFLPDKLLQISPLGAVNLHGSLLPKYRGAAPIQRAIWNGEAHSGVCLMWMVREMDAGDVIACAEEPILDTDNAATLSERLANRAADLLLEWLPALKANQAPRQPQNPTLVTFAPIIKKEERSIDWTKSAVEIWRQIRALAPAPAAVTTFRGQQVKVLEARPVSQFTELKEGEPGAIVELNPKSGLIVATGEGNLQLLSLQPAGKRPMSGADFLRGYRVNAGERFAS